MSDDIAEQINRRAEELRAMAPISPEIWAFIQCKPDQALAEAIAAAPALDRRNGAKDLRVRSPFEREQERLRLAEYFRKNGVI